jgi:hypothetical protein
MSRIHVSLVFLAAVAACGPKSSSSPVGHSGGTAGSTLAVTLGTGEDGGEWTRTLVPAEGSHFPAVSADGTTVVDLVTDAQDFSGIPIATVVLWTKSGIAESFQLVSAAPDESPAEQAKLEETLVAKVNARLAQTTWHPLEKVSATGENEDTGAPDTLDLGDGITIKLEQVRFPPPGTLPQADGGGGCGDVIGLTEGFGSRELGFAVVFPQATLGGDDCFGTPSAELGTVVPLP